MLSVDGSMPLQPEFSPLRCLPTSSLPLKGCAATSPNREGLDMDSISDDRLQASGEVEYAKKHNAFVSTRKIW